MVNWGETVLNMVQDEAMEEELDHKMIMNLKVYLNMVSMGAESSHMDKMMNLKVHLNTVSMEVELGHMDM